MEKLRGGDVEARQPQHAAQRVEDGDGQPGDPQVLERARVDEEGGRDAEGDGVGERVELHAELAGRVEHPRDPAVEHVAQRGREEQVAGVLEPALRGGDDPQEAEHDVRQRDRIGDEMFGLHGEPP
ncbi:MAG: hypothetical protein QM765_31130 [Myxococcales bacterium]